MTMLYGFLSIFFLVFIKYLLNKIFLILFMFLCKLQIKNITIRIYKVFTKHLKCKRVYKKLTYIFLEY